MALYYLIKSLGEAIFKLSNFAVQLQGEVFDFGLAVGSFNVYSILGGTVLIAVMAYTLVKWVIPT